ncbi:hypothetical protein ACHAXA_005807 [Cyclostephanos tholiformis]|uniref:Ubiquitin thioesterase OTU n=1 Tax=Cyclostephanos tholiformis TaxID=382380 RepID=A0ABD3RGQ4_9STRA
MRHGMASPPPRALIVILVLLLVASNVVVDVDSSIPRSSSGSTTIVSPSSSSSSSSSPSSRAAQSSTDEDDRQRRAVSVRPAWNASPRINRQGYLSEFGRGGGSSYTVSGGGMGDNNIDHHHPLDEPVVIRQVPGDGCCLFHAVAISLNLIQGRHLRMDDVGSLWDLKVMSRSLRRAAVRCLRSCTEGDDGGDRGDRRDRDEGDGIGRRRFGGRYYRHRRLFIQGSEYMSTSQLLSTASAQYGISPVEYCDLMEQDSYWGGGPEIVALCNVLRRPIHVYELVGATGGGRGGRGGKVVVDVDDDGGGGGDDDSNDSDDREWTWGGSWGGGGGRKRGGGNASYGGVPDRLINEKFRLRRMATFGSPKFDARAPVHILSADSRFPDISPECMKENGNHFMAIFPVNSLMAHVNMTREGGGGESR